MKINATVNCVGQKVCWNKVLSETILAGVSGCSEISIPRLSWLAIISHISAAPNHRIWACCRISSASVSFKSIKQFKMLVWTWSSSQRCDLLCWAVNRLPEISITKVLSWKEMKRTRVQNQGPLLIMNRLRKGRKRWEKFRRQMWGEERETEHSVMAWVHHHRL